MNARLLDMFHDAANQDSLAVAYRIHIDFDGIIHKTIQQYGGIMGNLDRLVHVPFQLSLLMDDFHRAASQNIARAYDKRITYFPGGSERPFRGARSTIGWLLQSKAVKHFLKTLPVFG